jgi:hypothetical protein
VERDRQKVPILQRLQPKRREGVCWPAAQPVRADTGLPWRS